MSDLIAKLEDDANANRRAWRNFLILFGLVVIALGFYIFKDDAPPDDDWMLPKFTPGGEGKNPLAVFIEAIKKHPIEDFSKLPVPVMRREVGQEPAMREFVLKNESVSLVFDELMKSDPATWHWPGIDEKISITTAFNGLSECQSVASQIQRMKVELLARDGKAEEAMTESIKTVHYGHGLCAVEGSVINYLVAMTVQMIGERCLQFALTVPGVSEEMLKRAQHELQPLDITTKELGFAMRVEYLLFKSSVDFIKKSNASITTLTGAANFPEVFLYQYFTRANRTLNNYLRLQKPVIQALENDWTASAVADKNLDNELHAWESNWLKFKFSSNVGGNMLVALTLPTFIRLGEKCAQNSALHRQAIIMIALRRFELEHGKLPEKLDELVPKFLDSVPTDPFDNAPMRWNATDRVVYSIGKDLKDDHGAVGEPRNNKDKDVGMRYWWSVKAE